MDRITRKRGTEALELLLRYLTHSNADVRSTIAGSFEHNPENAEVLVPALQAALDIETDSDVRIALERSLKALTNRGVADE